MLAVFAEEWPLLLFTLFTQLAVGVYIFIVFIRAFNKKIDRNTSIRITKKGMLFIGPVMFTALVFSIFHLGVPLKAYLSIGNITSSWLSKEILFASLFFAMWIASYALDRLDKWNQLFGWITSIVGLGVIYSMGSIYTQTVLPAWTDINTHIAFFGTTIIFGSIVTMVIILTDKEANKDQYQTILKIIGTAGMIAIVAQLVYLPVYITGLASNGGELGIATVTLLSTTYSGSIVIRWVLSIVALVMVAYTFISRRDIKMRYSLYVSAVLLVIAGEFIGRLIFYASGLH